MNEQDDSSFVFLKKTNVNNREGSCADDFRGGEEKGMAQPPLRGRGMKRG